MGLPEGADMEPSGGPDERILPKGTNMIPSRG